VAVNVDFYRGYYVSLGVGMVVSLIGIVAGLVVVS
jgi:hypothetical protein